MSTSLQRLRLLLPAFVVLSAGLASGYAQAPQNADNTAALVAAAVPQIEALRPALAQVSSAISNLDIRRWKMSGSDRSFSQKDVTSIQNDLNNALPQLLTQAETSPAGRQGEPTTISMAPAFALFRNIDALYDVLLRVAETAALTGPPADAAHLEDARSTLQAARGSLGDFLLQSANAQDAEIARLRAVLAATPKSAPVAPPSKVVIEDGPAPKKPVHKKKPVPHPSTNPPPQ